MITICRVEVEAMVVDEAGEIIWHRPDLPASVNLMTVGTPYRPADVLIVPDIAHHHEIKVPRDGRYMFQLVYKDVIFKQDGPFHMLRGEGLTILNKAP